MWTLAGNQHRVFVWSLKLNAQKKLNVDQANTKLELLIQFSHVVTSGIFFMLLGYADLAGMSICISLFFYNV